MLNSSIVWLIGKLLKTEQYITKNGVVVVRPDESYVINLIQACKQGLLPKEAVNQNAQAEIPQNITVTSAGYLHQADKSTKDTITVIFLSDLKKVRIDPNHEFQLWYIPVSVLLRLR